MGMAIDNTFGDQNEDFAAINEKLKRRRALAESLVANAMQDNGGAGYHGGHVYAVGNQLGNVAQIIGGTLMGRMADNDQQDLYTRQRQAEDAALGAIPSEGPERSAAQLKAFQQMPSLRDTLKAQMGMDEHEATRQFRQQEAEANRLEKSEQEAANRVARAEEGAANRQNRVDLRQMPAVVVHSGGGKSSEDIELDRELKQARINALNNPKPVASERKAALAQDDLISRVDNALVELERNPNAVGMRTLVPNIALNRLDPEGTAARAAIGELSAEKAHDIYGASFTAAERTRADKFIPADGDDLHTIRTKLSNMKKMAEQARARAAGQQPKQSQQSQQSAPSRLKFNPATGKVE